MIHFKKLYKPNIKICMQKTLGFFEYYVRIFEYYVRIFALKIGLIQYYERRFVYKQGVSINMGNEITLDYRLWFPMIDFNKLESGQIS